MSLPFLSENLENDSPITKEILRNLAYECGFKLSSDQEAAFLLASRSALDIATEVDKLEDYIDPSLIAVPTKGGQRTYRKPEEDENILNGWCHRFELEALKPDSQLLKGYQIALKDTIAVAGIPQTLGTSPQFVSTTGDYPHSNIDASVVSRLLLAGGTIVGTTTCENFSLSPMSYSAASGPVHNPWSRDFNSGGSSSGAATLVALGLAREIGVPGLQNAGPDVQMAIGGDQGGSIRIPAAYCGIYGLKPTHGLVPYTGIAGLLPLIDHVGPLGRTIEDIALCLSAIAGYDGLDARMGPESPLRQNVRPYHEELAGFIKSLPTDGKVTEFSGAGRPLRVGLIMEGFNIPKMSESVARIVKHAALEHFTASGSHVSDVSIPMHSMGASIWTAATRNQMASHAFGGRAADFLIHDLPHIEHRWPPDQEMCDSLTKLNPAVINTILGEKILTNPNYLPISAQNKAHRHVLQLRKAYDTAFSSGSFDILITPTTPTVAPPHPDMAYGSALDKLELAAGSINNTSPFNATGHPALSVPCGWGTASDGVTKLPIGMQIIGKRFDDLCVLKAAKIFELAGGGLGPWPGKA
ncbi:amidase signature domain-containing protein [Talaromyces proteolyticus]|uniref:Amidase signature domain-containing protein n=1 Tax=Talaromyces proteolyticus TaxID=1131652 RepID=A0AAD4PW48_9EURO|nr:amidase signature domain-containing protein [Talaromyces proteolyticus]KAH8697455.1 amidase signature domain-containing protein [Talaromyces proteolyticus]